MDLHDFAESSGIEKKAEKYPIIWKTEQCLVSECKSDRTFHRWSVPFTTPAGLTTECYDCHKTKRIYIEKTM